MIALNIELEDEGTDGIPDAYNYNGNPIPSEEKVPEGIEPDYCDVTRTIPNGVRYITATNNCYHYS